MKRHRTLVIGFWIMLLAAGPISAQEASRQDASRQDAQSIGSVTAVFRESYVTHFEGREALRVKLGGSVLFKDLYETRVGAQLKLLLDNDSVLSLGENTRLQITEHIYDPTQKQTVIDLFNGMLRSLVGKLIAQGGRFEIHTPTAVAAVRGTYFVVWTFRNEGGSLVTGVANIGHEGGVAVRNAHSGVEGSVTPGPLQYTLVEEGHPPTLPAQIDPALLTDLIYDTDIRDQVIEEIPSRLEAPGIDVADESVAPVPVPVVSGGTTPFTYFSTPPILQPPAAAGIRLNEERTPVTVNVLFP